MARDGDRGSRMLAKPSDHFRRSARRGRELPVEYAVAARDDLGGAAFRGATTLNIGVGGTFIVTDDPPPAGSRLMVRLTPPHGGPLVLRGDVRWIVSDEDDPLRALPRGMGVRFHDLDAEQLRLLRECFASLPAVINHDEA